MASGSPTAGSPDAGSPVADREVSRAFSRAARGGMAVHVPDDASAVPLVTVVEGDTVLTAGAAVPDASGIDHHVLLDQDRVDPSSLDLSGPDVVHSLRPRSAAPRAEQRFDRRLSDAADAAGATHRRHRTADRDRLGRRSPTEADGNALAERVDLFVGPTGFAGVRYRVPHRHPGGPVAADADDRAEVLVVTSAAQALASGPPGREPLDAVCDPDVLVTSDTDGGELLRRFTPSAAVVTDEHLGGHLASVAADVGTALGMCGTGERSTVTLSGTGVESSSLPPVGEVPALADADDAAE